MEAIRGKITVKKIPREAKKIIAAVIKEDYQPGPAEVKLFYGCYNNQKIPGQLLPRYFFCDYVIPA